MNKILAAGLSPAWQQILRFDAFRPGEVNRAAEAHWCASGKVLNVGIALAHLHAASHTLTVAGGQAAEPIRHELEGLGVPATLVPTQAATRVCTTILDTASSTTTELVENASPLAADELADFQHRFAQLSAATDFVVLSGSVPPGTPDELFSELLRTAGCPGLVDGRGAQLKAALSLRPTFVKPNREELAQTVGRPLDDNAALLSAMRELAAAGAAWVVVSQGPGAVWMVSCREQYRLSPPAVASVVNPIGCGDCLAAGIAAAVARGDAAVQAVRHGIAAAVDNLSTLLPARLDPDRVAELAERVQIDRLA